MTLCWCFQQLGRILSDLLVLLFAGLILIDSYFLEI